MLETIPTFLSVVKMSNGPYRKSNPLAVDRELGDAAARCWICKLIFGAVIDLLRSRAMLEAEMLVLRQQIMCCGVPILTDFHLGRLTDLYWEASAGLFPKMYDALAIVRPGTVIRWHRAGFRLYWRWKSRRRCGRSPVSLEIRRLIREMSVANPLWGAPRIHGELLKLGIEIGQTSVAKYGAQEGTSLAGVEDVPSQPCGWHSRDGPSSSCRQSRSDYSMGC
jgi:hypothetical protein